MTTLILTLPDEQVAQLNRKAAEMGLPSAEDLVRSLVDSEFAEPETDPTDALDPAAKEALEAELVRRLESGNFVTMDDADFKAMHEEIATMLAARGHRP